MTTTAGWTGRTLKHYRVLEQIGAGGMGVVFRARDERLGRDVALKLLPPASVGDEDSSRAFRREARTLSQLNHPHIATIHDFDEDEGMAFLVMEYIGGRSLDDRLLEGPLEEAEVLRLGIQLTDGLAAAHAQGIVHRDLKPGNLRLTPEGRLKILDFGLAKLLSHDVTDAATITQTQALKGTLPYMSPEQLRGLPADERSDVWAAGCVLYEMRAGGRPFRGDTAHEVSAAILSEAPAPLPPGTSGPLRAAIDRCLNKEPKRRYQSAGELHATLEAIRGGGVAPWLVLRYQLRRWRVAAAAAGVALAALLAFAVDAGGLRLRLTGAPAARIRSLAVLPLENISGDPDQAYLADGVHELLLTDLANVSGLSRVIARSSVMRYRTAHLPLSQIGRELQVDALITGAVLRAENRVRVTVQLVRAATEEQLWANRYERDLRDVLLLQSDIVGAITRQIDERVSERYRARARHRTVTQASNEALLKGMFHLNRGTPDGFAQGLTFLQQAVVEDPAHPLPYAQLALAYNRMGHGRGAAPDAFSRAKSAASKALALDENLAEAHAALAEAQLYYDWDWAGADASFRRALELNPNFAEARAHYSYRLLLAGRLEDAVAEGRSAVQLDPLSPAFNAFLGWLYMGIGQHENGIEAVRRGLEVHPEHPLGLYVLATGYAMSGQPDAAVATAEKAAAVTRNFRWVLGYALANAGRHAEARAIAAELEQAKFPDGWGLSEIYTALGEDEKALDWLERDHRVRRDWLPWIGFNPVLKPLHHHPRFQNLLRSMNLPG